MKIQVGQLENNFVPFQKTSAKVCGRRRWKWLLSRYPVLLLQSTYKYWSRVRTIQSPFVEKKGRIWSSLIGGNVPRFWLCFVAANIHCPKIFCGACESWLAQKFDDDQPPLRTLGEHLILSALLKFQHCLYCFGLLILMIEKVFSFGRRYFICPIWILSGGFWSWHLYTFKGS